MSGLSAFSIGGIVGVTNVTGLETSVEPGDYVVSREDARIVAALKAGDEAAFMQLVAQYGPSMLRVALLYVRTHAVAEEVVQDAWLGVLRGIDRFEGRSSLKTWVFRILTNTAKTRSEREGRCLPFSALSPGDLEAGEPSVDPDRFLGDHERWASHWSSSPKRFDALPEGRLLSRESMAVVQEAVDALPEAQRVVLTMRDI